MNLLASYRVVDIETVPDLTVWTPPPPRFVWEMSTARALSNEPQLIAEEAFPPPQAHRIVSIASIELTSDDDRYYFFSKAVVAGGWPDKAKTYRLDPVVRDIWASLERSLILDFANAQDSDHATIVTWNGRSFDLPVINLRALRHGIALPWYYQQEGLRYRYSEVGHCDLMDVFSDYGAARNIKLGDIARCIGLPGKFGDLSGSDVARKVFSSSDPSDFYEVNRYCLSDAFQTALLFVRSRYHKGMLDRLEHNRAIESFSASPDLQRTMPPDFNLSSLLIP